jgi:site-specific DNA-adenine methylase
MTFKPTLSFLSPTASFYQPESPVTADSLFTAIESEIDNKTKQLQQLVNSCKREEACLIIENVSSRNYRTDIRKAFLQWAYTVREMNNEQMQKDRNRWRMHAAANMEIDLQAWYHALFYQEVYECCSS